MLMPPLTLYEAPELYDLAFGPGPCEPFYREEARRAAGPVLELACGTGRLTIPIARDGHEIVGLDVSSAMLDAARCKAKQARVREATFVRTDMRSFALGGRFALVIVSCNSLAHLTTNDDLKACFSRIREHLRPGATVAFDIVNPRVTSLARSASEVVCLDTVLGCQGITVRETADYDPVTQIRTAQWRVRQGEQSARTLAPLCLRQIFPQELLLLLEAAGLKLVARYGDFDRGPFSGESLNQVCLCSG
ncbi:MAG TPA: class I SAM-dependent methyltransferase [Methyloceanibacter sp.]|nr:class I SAM-dependent methyltransferase [Methyloceanibacter sp.]